MLGSPLHFSQTKDAGVADLLASSIFILLGVNQITVEIMNIMI
jgi:hypothetical protein